ncbi:relaxase/mobilization nuclease domain-containing protein [Flavobacterium sp. RNTU_13]|uniref:relaxase/mobilization nuclease domain-containing protein n=1 Tax=Flavobacterium sp. RNTU_13 TaxID=3375145 RepID=UPI00398749B4
MVAVIKTGHSIRGMLNYNENKIKEGKALCIGQHNYPLDADRLSYAMKLNLMQRQVQLNENVKRNTVHISLNFDPSEANLPKEKLLEIAEMYMNKIGFGQQPYLIYQHHDAGHPHLHITTINVQANGKRIAMNNIGRDKSEPARKEIEQSFNLVKAEDHKKIFYRPEPVSTRVQYGKAETKKAIESTLMYVINNYRYTSLPELNAVLKLYNITADKGTENSRLAKHNGLLYHALDAKGNPVGVPIKASRLYSYPTLKGLETLFKRNETVRSDYKIHIKRAIDQAFFRSNIIMLPQLIKAIEKEGIETVIRKNAEGLVYGITFVDHKNHCVFNGSSIGKEYSAKGLHNKCDSNQIKMTAEGEKVALSKQELIEILEENKGLIHFNELPKFMDLLMKAENDYEYVTKEFKSRRKKRGLRS